MSQRQQLERVLEIDRLIRAGLYPHPDRLARDWEVSRRVLFKDRDFMVNRLGAPIVFDRVHRGWKYTDPTYSLPAVTVTEGELLALVLGVECAKRYAGTALEASLRSAVAKISRSLKGPVSVDLDAVRGEFSVERPPSVPTEEKVLTTLLEAIRDRRLVRMRYFSAYRREESERTVQPVHLLNREGDWYLIAYDRSREDYRFFHAGRIRKLAKGARALGARPPEEVRRWLTKSFHALTGSGVTEVAVRFDAEQAPYVRDRVWHESQQVEELPGGAIVLRFRTAGLIGVRRWVLQYGPHAEVLEPQPLREELLQEAEGIRAVYSRPSRRLRIKKGKERSAG